MDLVQAVLRCRQHADVGAELLGESRENVTRTRRARHADTLSGDFLAELLKLVLEVEAHDTEELEVKIRLADGEEIETMFVPFADLDVQLSTLLLHCQLKVKAILGAN